MCDLREAFNVCFHDNTILINDNVTQTKFLHCKDCNKKFKCNHSFGSYNPPGIWNGTAPKYCNKCHVQLTDLLGRKIALFN